MFRKIAAQVDGEPCCRYMGPDGAGHYVKMVHNGIEYGDIQLICEAYAILKDILGMDAAQLANIFAEWNKDELESYLIEITSKIFRQIDPETSKPLVDVILDKAGQKGTGIWTLQAAIKQYVVISTINAAVEARVISSRKEERVAASKILPQPRVRTFKGNRDRSVAAVRDALYASKMISYAQRICCKRNAISLVRTRTSASISPASSTPSGSSLRKNVPKNWPNRKHTSHITRASRISTSGGLLSECADTGIAALPTSELRQSFEISRREDATTTDWQRVVPRTKVL